jgi:UDP:flavonoid glycosyltransferase YjiC (YdhE family)
VPNKIVGTTIGSKGDLDPIIALGLAAQWHGFEPVFAVPKSDLAKVTVAGLAAGLIMPDFDIGGQLGMTDAEIVKAVMANTDFWIHIAFLQPSCSAIHP